MKKKLHKYAVLDKQIQVKLTVDDRKQIHTNLMIILNKLIGRRKTFLN
jgi:hypothetical protein